MRKYSIVDKSFLAANGLEEHCWYDDYIEYIVWTEDNKTYHWVGNDGGEPEDRYFTRDWAWVDAALQAAYDSGFVAGNDYAFPSEARASGEEGAELSISFDGS